MPAELSDSQKLLLDFTTDAYLTSNDFSGVHFGSLPPELTAELRQLLEAGLIERVLLERGLPVVAETVL